MNKQQQSKTTAPLAPECVLPRRARRVLPHYINIAVVGLASIRPGFQ